MKLYQFKELHRENFNAGSKAVDDAFEIARRLGAKPLRILRFTESDFPLPRCVNRLIGWFVWKVQELWLRAWFPRDAVLFLQHQQTTGRALMRSEEGMRLVHSLRARRNLKVITLVHDLAELRATDRNAPVDPPDSIESVLSYSDAIIVHNKVMHDWLCKYGNVDKAIIVLELFDYLTTSPFANIATSDMTSISFAGNLRPDKCGFLRRINEVSGVSWFLYGANFNPSAIRGTEIRYCGCMRPAELPQHMCHGFGLVWDGDELDSCVGKWGEYLRWNNPHKLSLYLASGLPVITWSKAATAKFIKEHAVGFVVDSLKDIPMVFSGLTEIEYTKMCKNVRELADRLRSGEFLSAALHKALEVCLKRSDHPSATKVERGGGL